MKRGNENKKNKERRRKVLIGVGFVKVKQLIKREGFICKRVG